MLFDSLHTFALSFDGAFEDHPFGLDTTVYKAPNGKMFVICSEDAAGALLATVKLTPDEGAAALTLPFVSVARYVGRYGWVTAHIREEVELDITLEWVRRSFDLVAPKRRAKS